MVEGGGGPDHAVVSGGLDLPGEDRLTIRPRERRDPIESIDGDDPADADSVHITITVADYNYKPDLIFFIPFTVCIGQDEIEEDAGAMGWALPEETMQAIQEISDEVYISMP